MSATSSSARIAIVTGGNSGIGQAIAENLARDHHVYALSRRAASESPFTDHAAITPVSLDIRDHAQVAEFIASLPRIDVLIHSAAIAKRFSVADATPDDWQQQFAINVFAPAELTRQALPKLRQQHGQVVFINSGSGTRPLPGHAVYSASKFALHALAETLRNEERQHGVRVATVYPGPTATPMNPLTPEESERDKSAPASIASAVRLIVDSTPDSQVTELVVRPFNDPAAR